MNPDQPNQLPGQSPVGQPVQPTQQVQPIITQPTPQQYAAPPSGMPMMNAAHRKPIGLIIALVVFILGFLAMSGFAFWAYAQMQDYKNNVDDKVAVAVDAAVKQTEESKEKEFLERSKSPFKKYKGPATFGAVEITYPRTWAAFVDENVSGGTPVRGRFHPDFVPGERSDTAFALEFEVIEQPYDKVLGSFDNEAKSGKVKVSPFKAARVPSVLGARVDGEVKRDYQGSSILLPLRDKTIKLTTYSGQSFGKDFNDIILKNFIFTP